MTALLASPLSWPVYAIAAFPVMAIVAGKLKHPQYLGLAIAPIVLWVFVPLPLRGGALMLSHIALALLLAGVIRLSRASDRPKFARLESAVSQTEFTLDLTDMDQDKTRTEETRVIKSVDLT
jgi:hypothetical protein